MLAAALRVTRADGTLLGYVDVVCRTVADAPGPHLGGDHGEGCKAP